MILHRDPTVCTTFMKLLNQIFTPITCLQMPQQDLSQCLITGISAECTRTINNLRTSLDIYYPPSIACQRAQLARTNKYRASEHLCSRNSFPSFINFKQFVCIFNHSHIYIYTVTPPASPSTASQAVKREYHASTLSKHIPMNIVYTAVCMYIVSIGRYTLRHL